MPEIRTVIVASHHKGPGAITALAGLEVGHALELRREPDNQADPQAIAVHAASGECVGYIPSRVGGDLGPVLDAGATVRAEVTRAATVDAAQRVRQPAKITIEWAEPAPALNDALED